LEDFFVELVKRRQRSPCKQWLGRMVFWAGRDQTCLQCGPARTAMQVGRKEPIA